MKRFFTLVMLAVLALPAWSQDTPQHNLEAFQPPVMLPPSSVRSADGRPGPDYWQQGADYRIRATLDTVANRVTGSVTIDYTNNSPHTLDALWLQLDQNLFAPGSRGAAIQPADSRWRGSFDDGGYQITGVRVGGSDAYTPIYLIDDTRMRLELRAPLAANGGQVELTVDYNFIVPQYGADRMGRLATARGTIYEIAQWYPRMYVYDDVQGWNALPYHGQGEFYLNYGDYDIQLTVPHDMIVVSTGALQNPEQVLTPEQQQRVERARTSAATVMIVAPDEVGTPGSRPRQDGMLTWRFKAENVRDVAWAASRAFVWDAASWDGILLQSAYPHEGIGEGEVEGWEMSTQYLHHTIKHYSEQWFRYPYPVAINVAGVVGGMEYPMIVFCSVRARGQTLFGVTDHEFGHTWFPMIVGSDERRYAWMDEGFNTFINYYSNLEYYGDASVRNERVSPDYISGLMRQTDTPIATPPDRIRRGDLGFLAYRKPGYGLRVLREYIVGPERFDLAFREYIDRWAYKHPKPADFFRTIENVAGEDLGYFWNGWFYTNNTFDQGITGVEKTEAGTEVTISNLDELILPTTLQITYEDGTTERRRIPALAWATSDTFTELVTKPVRNLTLDPDTILPDTDRSNDVWGEGIMSTPAQPRGGR